MSFTAKADGTYEAPWFVVPDDPSFLRVGPEDLNDLPLDELQKLYIARAFGLKPAEYEGLSAFQTFMYILPLWRAQAAISNDPNLQGQPVADEGSKPAAKPAGRKKTAKPAAAKEEKPAEPEAPPHPHQKVLDEIAKAESKSDVADIFLDNKEAFEDPTVAEAASEKRKSF